MKVGTAGSITCTIRNLHVTVPFVWKNKDGSSIPSELYTQGELQEMKTNGRLFMISLFTIHCKAEGETQSVTLSLTKIKLQNLQVRSLLPYEILPQRRKYLSPLQVLMRPAFMAVDLMGKYQKMRMTKKRVRSMLPVTELRRIGSGLISERCTTLLGYSLSTGLMRCQRFSITLRFILETLCLK